MKRWVAWALIIGLTMSLPLSVTSTPPSNPLLSYRIRGLVTDDAGHPLDGIPVALAGKCRDDSLVLLQPGTSK
jgi:hypothetical protein